MAIINKLKEIDFQRFGATKEKKYHSITFNSRLDK